MPRHRNNAASWIGGWLVFLVACGDPTAAAPSAAAAPAPVVVAAVREGALDDAWRLAADVRALARADLAPQVPGAVVSVAVREGDRVARGAVIAVVDPDLAAADVVVAEGAHAAAEADAALAQLEVSRLDGLAEGVVSAQERDGARARRDAAVARARQAVGALDRAREVLARHTLRAPFDGVVAVRRVDPGDHVAVGQIAVELVAYGGVEVVVDGPAALVGTLRVGDAATLHGPGGATATARIAGLVPALDPVARTARVRLEPAEFPSWLLPGAAVQAVLPFTRAQGEAVIVPRDALLEGAGGAAVVRVSAEGTAERLDVEVVSRNASDALVRGALAVGDPVIVRGNERVRPGQAVQVQGAGGS